MEFKFSKREELLQWAVNDFGQKEIAAKELNTLSYVPANILKKMGDLGFFSMRVPEKYGGKPGAWVTIGVLIEEIAKANMSIGYLTMLSYEISLLLSIHGADEVKEEWLQGVCQGRKLGCISITEPHCGSDFSAIETRAVRDGDSYYISGEKNPISFGTQADFTITFAKIDHEKETKGITAFLVPLDLPGIKKTRITTMGLLPSDPASFIFSGVNIPVKNRIGSEGEGFQINADTGLFSDFNQVISGLISLGTAQTALGLAISYGKNRVAFGRPIAGFEAISGRIAEDATLIEAGRWLCYRTLWLKDQGLPDTKEAAMCGWWCPKVAFKVIEDALLIHGHTGYSNDLPFQQMLRDVTGFEIIAGTEQILKLIIAQRVIGKVAVPVGLSGEIGYGI
jgi:cyclohexanecarboxyl-CoA dehydrogenase